MTGARATPEPDKILHATCVAVDQNAVLIIGGAGSGKSSLALEMIGQGGVLVADDRTCLIRRDPKVIAFAPNALTGLIEARGVGILKTQRAPPTPVTLVVNMDREETERLPPSRSCDLLGRKFPLLDKVPTPHFATAVMLYLRNGVWSTT